MSDAEIVRDVLTRATNETATKMLPVDVFLDASLALDRLESQNQALQRALKEIRDLKPAPGETPTHQAAAFWRSLAFVDMQTIARRALSPTQETDPG